MSVITEEDLHAYVDNLLEPERRDAVWRYLQSQPEIAERVAAYQAQREALRAAYAGWAAEPIPPSLDLARLLEDRLTRRRAPWRIAASLVACLGLGAAAGWSAEATFHLSSPRGVSELVREAVASYVVFAADQRRPVELWSTQRDDLARWLSNRLNRPISPPDLTPVGYRLMGGRLVATDLGPAGLFMYDNEQGRRISIFVRPMRTTQHSAMRAIGVAGVDSYSWVSNGVGYSVVGPNPSGDLQRVSEHAKSEIEGPG